MTSALTSLKRLLASAALGALLASASCAIGASDETPVVLPADAGVVHESGVACMTNDDCPKSTRPCEFGSCSVGRCDFQHTARSVVVHRDSPADCHAVVCDGAGDTETIVDRSNVPSSDVACVVGTCDVNGNPGMAASAAGTPCTSASGGTRCDGAGNCVHCLGDGDCAIGQTCNVLKYCEVPLCMDGFKDSRETDVDCGGVCPPCSAGRVCKHDVDCQSGACDPLTKTCLRATCSDGIKDDNETDVDCGGSCSVCQLGSRCVVDQDCASKACDLTLLTCVADQCSDGRRENIETDVDCGGGTCPGCAVGLSCRIFSDCLSGVCDAPTQKCIPYVDPCTDGILDGAETDVDCGGGRCPQCGLGQPCFYDFDCTTNACDGISATCVSDPCTDHRWDGGETDLDCGGANACARCPLGRRCVSTSDCVSGTTCLPGFPHVCQ